MSVITSIWEPSNSGQSILFEARLERHSIQPDVKVQAADALTIALKLNWRYTNEVVCTAILPCERMIQIISTLLLRTILAIQAPDVVSPPEIVFPPDEKIITEVLSVRSATVSRVQSPATDKSMKPIVLGPSVTPPRVIYSAQPAPVGDSQKGKPIGDVILRIVVGADGKVHDVRVERSLSKDMDAQAIKAVKTWTFQPATKNGKPVAVFLDVEITFHSYE